MAAMLKVQNAAKLINEALPSVPMGSEFHGELLKLATTLNKILAKMPENPGMQATNLVQQARQTAQQGPAQAALSALYPPKPGQPPQAPGAAPGPAA